MQPLEYIYEETAIHFLKNPNDRNVMVNATDMAKAFGKRTDVFLKTDHAKAFIDALIRTPNGGRKEDEIIQRRSRNGVFFDRRLALKFAAWLSPEFEVWVYSKIDDITYGHYKEHWDAHCDQQDAAEAMVQYKEMLLAKGGSPELVAKYFDAEKAYKNAGKRKQAAIRNQLKISFEESL